MMAPPLTREEFNGFIDNAVPFLKSMESKNHWDFFVNDFSVYDFCNNLLAEAVSLNNYKDWQKYNQKVKDLCAIWEILMNADWTKENETVCKHRDIPIWELVLNKVNSVADSVF